MKESILYISPISYSMLNTMVGGLCLLLSQIFLEAGILAGLIVIIVILL